MLGRISVWRHVPVVLTIALLTMLAGCGLIAGKHPERFDTWHVVIEPWPEEGPNALRITETFDQDFGSHERHGPVRYLPSDEFGTPTDIRASSPDAPAGVFVDRLPGEVAIRIGDPGRVITGQHRYTLAYTYPEAMLDRGLLAIDALDGDEFETSRAEVIVRGFELAAPRCFAGPPGSTDRCDLNVGNGLYRAVFEPLPAHTAVTIDGEIVRRIDPVDLATPPIPERRRSDRLQAMLIVAGLGLLGAGAVLAWALRRGRNEVFVGGAADAAFGTDPTAPTRLVADTAMDELATVEFAPPDGIDPWEGRVLLTERLDDDTVAAWFSGMAGKGAIELSEKHDRLQIAKGDKYGKVHTDDASLLGRLFAKENPYLVRSVYDPTFSATWSGIRGQQRGKITASGWWKRLPPSKRSGRVSWVVWLVIAVCIVPWLVTMFFLAIGLFSSWWVAAPLAVLLPALIAWFTYRFLLPARSAIGSALALRTESFRRFLHASEGQHVEWAWDRGVLREYSAWAVALDEADAWGRALAAANVPEPATLAASPLIMPRFSSALQSSHSAPTSSGGSGSSSSSSSSSSFDGGSSGGGGGGGSRGSW